MESSPAGPQPLPHRGRDERAPGGAGAGAGAAPPERLALSFTGGKDCVLAAHILSGYTHPHLPRLPDLSAHPPGAHVKPLPPAGAAPGGPAAAPPGAPPAPPPVSLLAVFAPAPAPGERLGGSFRAHPIAVIEAQAEALGLPLVVCEIGPPYPERYVRQISRLREEYGVTGLVTGDISDVAGGFMAAAAAAAGVRLVTPLWGVPRPHLLQALLDLGISARVSCVSLPAFAAAAPGPDGKQGRVGAGAGAGADDGDSTGDGACPCACHCAPARPPPPGPPRFDAVGRLLGRPLAELFSGGALGAAQAAVGIDGAGEDGSYHTVVERCPLMAARGARVELRGAPRVDGGSGYAYMVWDAVGVERDEGGGGGGGGAAAAGTAAGAAGAAGAAEPAEASAAAAGARGGVRPRPVVAGA
ncbi:hypothetical protein Rsub_11799 [Raphidocelis subcapitata]|uniref:Diphthine--ammonia ligase n=1 Tax=Raphidocelis subcapitata TaxID=307507 RepID=A0A2V0PP87_9CHLO|nr:hypothetical protein Rsub_11799 [Raphidocelis subcapitata]|eukprot:GBF98995.1 hypothetical protein Rsub_11799 [Raphidocelis subcapitata]